MLRLSRLYISHQRPKQCRTWHHHSCCMCLSCTSNATCRMSLLLLVPHHSALQVEAVSGAALAARPRRPGAAAAGTLTGGAHAAQLAEQQGRNAPDAGLQGRACCLRCCAAGQWSRPTAARQGHAQVGVCSMVGCCAVQHTAACPRGSRKACCSMLQEAFIHIQF
jgi:hypothetical protein